jgi:peptidoglycan/LPS O-acetylase OafA/YrhL
MFMVERETLLVNTVGLLALTVASMVILMALVAQPVRVSWPGRVLGYVGLYSYSIYLWHFAVRNYTLRAGEELLRTRLEPLPAFLMYALLSVACGIVLGKLIEMPILHVRNRLFPSRASAFVVHRDVPKKDDLADSAVCETELTPRPRLNI